MTTSRRQSRESSRRMLPAAVVAVTMTVLTACGGGGPAAHDEWPDAGGPGDASSMPPGASASAQPREELPPRTPGQPAAARPAQRLNRAERVLRTRDGGADAVRRAGETQQRLTRRLHEMPPGPRRAVLSRLDAGARATMRANLTAQRTLGELVRPQPRLPDWRIVEPPSPERLRELYGQAQRRSGIHWSYLAAIHLVETRTGRIEGTSTAGAQGPMQFIPGTWDLYGQGGDIDDPHDAILAAGRLLAANGGPEDMAGALYAYNQSDAYVAAVQAYAARMRAAPHTYRGYWSWRVYYEQRRGTYLLPVGYPEQPGRPVPPYSVP